MSSSIHISRDGEQNYGQSGRGQLKVFLGYAAGVGKTYRMLEEAQQLKRQGKDIVVGYFEPHGRKDTIAKADGLEIIPRRTVVYRGCTFQEMDIPAILSRRPAICVVDELAHTNVPGSERSKRWEDVQVLLDVGIEVMTNMNIQHLESLNDQVFRITGIRVRETVPDWFVKSAAEVVMVDATTGALLNRLKRGDIYAPEKPRGRWRISLRNRLSRLFENSPCARPHTNSKCGKSPVHQKSVNHSKSSLVLRLHRQSRT